MLPSFIIVGAFKAGTTTLSQILLKHPMLRSSAALEPHFFDSNFDKGVLWYRKQFPLLFFNARKKAFEATPSYLYHPLVAKRIADTLPDVKLVILLRNPIERAISHFNFNVKKGIEYLNFKETMKRESEFIEAEKSLLINASNYHSKLLQNFSYIDMGFYDKQLDVVLQHFDMKQLLFLDSNSFHAQPQQTIDSITNFVGVSAFKVDSTPIPIRSGLEELNTDVLEELKTLYASTIIRTKEITGINLEL